MILFYFLSSMLIVSFPTEAAYASHNCSTLAGNSITSTFKFNLNQLLSTLSSKANRTDTAGFYYATVGPAYGLFRCSPDVSVRFCEECVANAASDALLLCPDNPQVVVWYDDCMLRYSNQPFHSGAATLPELVIWSPRNLRQYVEGPAELNDKFATANLIWFTVFML